MTMYRCRVQAANKMKTELGLAQELNASDAVVAGAELLGVTFESGEGGKTLTLKERVAVLCREAVSYYRSPLDAVRYYLVHLLAVCYT